MSVNIKKAQTIKWYDFEDTRLYVEMFSVLEKCNCTGPLGEQHVLWPL